jgi:hypothetical protein
MSYANDDSDPAADLSATDHSVMNALQTFAAEVTEFSRQSIEHTNDAIERLRNARSLPEVLAIQTDYAQGAFALLSQHTRSFTTLMTSFPQEMSKAWTKSVSTAIDKTEAASEKVAANVERLSDSYRNP